jgi:hypothetical protein
MGFRKSDGHERALMSNEPWRVKEKRERGGERGR